MIEIIPLTFPHSNSKKSPNVSSIPSLVSMDPFAKFEFHYPADEFWWDESSDCDTEVPLKPIDIDVSARLKELQRSCDLEIPKSTPYQIHFPIPTITAIPKPKEEKDFIDKIIDTVHLQEKKIRYEKTPKM